MTEKISNELKKLVLWKLETEIPSNFKLSIGNKGAFTKEQLIEHVEKEDEIGRLYINMEFKFLQALVKGEISKELAS